MIHHVLENGKTPVFDDNALREMYMEYDIPCDRLVSDPAELFYFKQAYTQRTDQEITCKDLAHRLLTLRKLGQAKGGLPRLRRW